MQKKTVKTIENVIVKGFINACLTMLIMGAAYSEEMCQIVLVSHFYDLWMKVDEGMGESVTAN